MAFKGAMSGFKPKYDDEDEAPPKKGADKSDDVEGEEDDDESLGSTLIRAIRAGTGSTVVELIRQIAGGGA